jgi:hypothetical protein
VGSVGSILHSGASRAQNNNELFFPRGGASVVSINMCFASGGIYGSRSAFRSDRGLKHGHTIFQARVASLRFPKKACWDRLRRSCVFASYEICVSRSTFRYVWGIKWQHSIFYPCVGPVRIQRKVQWDMLRQTCVFATGGNYRSQSAFRCLWDVERQRTIFHAQVGLMRIKKSAPRHITLNLCFCIRWDPQVT